MYKLSRDLLADIDAFMGKHGVYEHEFGRLVRNDTGLVARLRKGRPVSAEISAECRRFMQNYSAPSRAPAEAIMAPMAAVDTVAARVEYDQRQLAQDRARLRDPVAKVMTLAGPETPGEAIKFVAGRWPDMWAGIVIAARERQIPPGAMMMQLLQDGLAAQADAA